MLRRAVLVLSLVGPAGVLADVVMHATGYARSEGNDFLVGGWAMSVAFWALGVLVLRRQPDNAIAWILLAIGAGVGSSMALLDAGPGLIASGVAGGYVVLMLGVGLGELGWPLLWVLPHFFPDGRPAPGRFWHGLAWFAVGFSLLGFVMVLLQPGPVLTLNDPSADPATMPRNPLGVALVGTVQEQLGSVTAGVSRVVVIGGGAASLVWRWWRADDELRRQISAFALALPVTVGFVLVSSVVPGLASPALVTLGLVALPTALGVAILRYRLYEVDRLLSRTVAWASLTVVLVAVYVGAVALTTRLLPFSSTIGVTLATLACAALFHPLRRALQRAVDRRFDRAGWDARQEVAAFGERIRGDLAPEEVAGELLVAVQRAVAPRSAGVWLRPPGR